MLQASTLTFLQDLAANNTREWFQANKSAYEAARDNFLAFTTEMIAQIAVFEPEMGQLQAKECVFRIYKDTRFSKDKTPYKTNMGAYFTIGGRHSIRAGYYLHIEPSGESFLAGGIYQPQSDALKKIRQEIDYHPADLLAIISAPNFKEYFGQLTGSKLNIPPKGYDKNHPSIELLKHKDFLASCTIDPKQLTMTNFATWAAQRFEAIKPLNDFLNRAVLG